MIRFATQLILGLLLLFGTATLIPKGMLMIKLGKRPRGVFYIIMGVVCTFFSLLSFLFSYTVFKELST